MVITPPHTDVDDERKRIERTGALDLREGLFGLPFRQEKVGIPVVRRCIARIQLDSPFELPFRGIKIPIVRLPGVRQRSMTLGERIVQLHGFESSRFGFWHCLARRQHVDTDRAK